MTRTEHSKRPARESLSKRLGKVAKQIAARDCNRCAYCSRTAEESGAHLHLDHLTPRKHGGEDIAANLVLACRRCNSARQDKLLPAWQSYALEFLGLTFSARAVRAQALRKLPEIVKVPKAKKVARRV